MKLKKQNKKISGRLAEGLRSLAAVLAGAFLTFVFFLSLPFLQQMGRPPENGLEVRSIDSAVLQPPPPPIEEEKKEEEEQEEPPPAELTEHSADPLDLSQIEMALGAFDDASGSGILAGGKLRGLAGDKEESQNDSEAIFSMADLDQAPRAINQQPPRYPPELKSQKLKGTVYVLFVVDKNGRVIKPVVQKSTHPSFEKPALEAVRQWKFEPGKRNGQTVQFRMRVPITFVCG